MELLDRYLKAVRPLLPDAQRDDILDELSEEIRAQMRERELDLGRPLTEAEQNAVLERYGNPLLVGGRYHENLGSFSFGRELIGRELFPFYVKALKVTFSISITLAIVIQAGLTIAGLMTVGDGIQGMIWHLVIQFAVLTGVFCAIQGQLTRHPEKWRDTWWETGEVKVQKREKSPLAIRFEAVVEFAVAGVILSWLVGTLGRQPFVIGPARLAEAVHVALWPLAGATLLSMGAAVATFLRPAKGSGLRGRKVIETGIWAATFGYLYQAGTWVVLNDATGNLEEKRRAVQALNDLVFRYGILSVLAVLIVVFLWELSLLLRRPRTELR